MVNHNHNHNDDSQHVHHENNDNHDAVSRTQTDINSQHHQHHNQHHQHHQQQDWLHERECYLYEELLVKAKGSGRDTTMKTLRVAARRCAEKEAFEVALHSGNKSTISDAPYHYWQAITSETIALYWNLNPWSLFAWAERHGIELLQVNAGGRLCKENAWVWRDFYNDLPLDSDGTHHHHHH